MIQAQSLFQIQTSGQGFYEFTSDVEGFVGQQGIQTGLLTLFCRHTSCSLLIQENADSDVRVDMKEYFKRLVPENVDWFTHVLEGADDMPAHIKTALTQTSLSIPVANGEMVLGTWQGIYLFEHRDHNHRRQVVAHLLGE